MRNLQDETIHTLNQLKHFLSLISPDQYKCDIPVLHGNTIGKHIRHIIEFYETLLESESSNLNYDLRKRSLLLENNRDSAVQKLEEIAQQINALNNDANVIIEGNYSESDSSQTTHSPSSLSRELGYNLEHCIHHMAIIRIGVEQLLPTFQISPDFGVARSTLRNLRVAQKVS